MPKTNQPEDLSARDAASQPEEQPQADAPAEEKKPDLLSGTQFPECPLGEVRRRPAGVRKT